jgi:transcriptional regulator with XRE-family HTH domain
MARDLTQEALARLADVSPKHVSEVERGNREPKLGTILKLVTALGLHERELCDLYRQLAAADG